MNKRKQYQCFDYIFYCIITLFIVNILYTEMMCYLPDLRATAKIEIGLNDAAGGDELLQPIF